MCKLKESLFHRRLAWLLEKYEILPNELSVFRKRRGTADAVGNLCSAFEDAKFNRENDVYIVFFDVSCVFDTLPHATILNQLRLHGVQERLLAFVESFLKDRMMSMRRRVA